ncbi:MAG: hypothetical protein NTY35_02745 [Planctomycetota bacterium]|nr:hypothetical protein [Planctomycetota bacterium]
MSSRPLVASLLVGLLASTAAAQAPGTPPARTPIKPTSRASAQIPPPPMSSLLPPAGADDCANASTFAISGTGTFAVDSTTATDSPQIGTGCVQAHRDVWFQWTATYTGNIELNLCGGTTTDSVVAVWAGSACPSGAALACNDDSCGLQSRVTFAITNGSVYLIQIGSFGTAAGYAGTFNLVAPPPPPSNDECATAVAVTGTGTFPFDNTTATTSVQGQTEAACLFFGSTAMNRDVWFTWTAPATGVATFATCTLTTVDTKIAVYPGAGCPSAGTVLACNDDSCAGFQSSVDFPVTAGSQYTLEIGVYPTAVGGTGSFSLTIPPPPPPPIPASINVDIGSPTTGAGFPGNTFGGGAGQPGIWNTRSAAVASSQLNDLSGTPCGAVLTRTGTNLADFFFTSVGPTGDDAALLNDAQDVGGTGGTTTWTFSNLFGGNYRVYTYAWAPDNSAYISSVSVAGSTDPVQNVGGAWPGSQTLGVTYARHTVNAVPSGGSIAITVSTVTSFGTLNGFQIERVGVPFTSYCFGDGTGVACPCGNNGTAGNGCGSSVNASGGNLAASGFPSVTADSVVLQGTGMPNSSCLYFQGTAQLNNVFGDGLRCVGGTVIRLGTKTNVVGASQYPVAGDLSVSVRGVVPAAGGTRNYQAWYRNAAAFCTASTFNLTNGVQIPWQP